MAYYAKVKTGTTNIRLRDDLYQHKGINLTTDKTADYRLSPYTIGGGGATNTYGSHLGREVNPWISVLVGGGDDRTTGMAQFNSPEGYWDGSTFIHPVRLGTLSGAQKWYIPFNPNTGANTAQFVNFHTLHDGGLTPAWNQNNHYCIFLYAARRTNDSGLPYTGTNFITSVRRSDGNVRMTVGSLSLAANGDIGFVTNDATVNYTSIFSQIAPLNVGQGHGTPYDANSDLGSSTQIGCIYRNSAGNERYRIATVNTLIATQTATISLGTEQSFPASYGASVFAHSAVNMGKGVMWAPYHRGANYARIAWLDWSSGTTATRGQYLASTISATNTLSPGDMIKASDELAFWFYPRRNGQSSGNARAISVSVFTPSGANNAPVLRGSWNLATYDFGATQTANCGAALGGSTDADYLTGIVVWSRADTDTAYIMPWHYRISNNAFTFVTNRITTLGVQADSYRTKPTVVHLGTSQAGDENYYEVSISGNNGTHIVQLTATSDIGNSNYTLTQNTVYEPAQNFGTAVRRSVSIRYSTGGRNEQMPWIQSTIPSGFTTSRAIQTLHLYTDTSNVFKLGLHNYRL